MEKKKKIVEVCTLSKIGFRNQLLILQCQKRYLEKYILLSIECFQIIEYSKWDFFATKVLEEAGVTRKELEAP